VLSMTGTLANIDVSGASQITLLVSSNGNNSRDHAMWAEHHRQYRLHWQVALLV
jgi:hypothetical protein